ncbi:hypothetical protein ACMFMG_010597 [Clarireedia jacksonii]
MTEMASSDPSIGAAALCPPPTNFEASPFLRLPSELRLLIYKYTIPHQVPLASCNFNSTPTNVQDQSSLRKGAIMRVNRKIHHEVIGLYYSTASFSLNLAVEPYDGSGFKFAPGLLLCLGNVKILNLSMNLYFPGTIRARELVSAHLASGCLEQLNIHLTMGWWILPFFQSEEELRSFMDSNLSPFQLIRRLKICTTEIHYHYINNLDRNRVTEIERLVRKYLDSFERNLLGNTRLAN